MDDRFVSLLGLCKKAGRLVMGFDPVKEALLRGQAYLVLLSADLSPKSAKEAEFLCRQDNIPVVTTDLTMDQIWYCLGKRSGVLAITDKGFSEKLAETARR